MALNEVLERRTLIRAVNLNQPFVLRRYDYFHFPLWMVSVCRGKQDELTFGELHRSFDDALNHLKQVVAPFITDPEFLETYRNDDKIEVALNPKAA